MLRFFPNLGLDGYTETSTAAQSYNCIAWTAGVDHQWWWPDPQNRYTWPSEIPRLETLDTFVAVFTAMGYARCDQGDWETGFEKIALYIKAGKPTHAARQLSSGRWTSKLGRDVDITHTLRGLEGQVYGAVTAFLKRPAKHN